MKTPFFAGFRQSTFRPVVRRAVTSNAPRQAHAPRKLPRQPIFPMTSRSLLAPVALLALLIPAPAFAWFPQGHSIIAEGAVKALPQTMPSWFRAGAGQIAHDAQDPDIQKDRTLPHMTEQEYPEHFIDLELLKGRPLPATRREFEALCAELNVKPSDAGEVPYAIAEWTERLTMAFAESRRYPQNRYIQRKALVYAGILSHYSGDLCMPLHTTVDYDGRLKADGTSPKSGIHAKVDSLVERLKLKPADLAKAQTVAPLGELLPAIVSQLAESRTHIDQTYALESQLPPEQGAWTPSPAVVDFTTERARTATRFTASLFLTAWEDSAKVKLPSWLVREEKTP